MNNPMTGLHHVTAISGGPQDNIDFMAGTLGQRFIKRTVNFDAPDTYHLYYGDSDAAPGSVMTYFPFVNAEPGRAGNGMASALAYAVPAGGLDAWVARFAAAGVGFDGPHTRFGERLIAVRAPDGLCIELIETARAKGDGPDDGFHGVTLHIDRPEATARLLTDVFGYSNEGAERAGMAVRRRFLAAGQGRGSVIDIVSDPSAPSGRSGAGTIHHIAFRAKDDADQLSWRARAMEAGMDVTPVIDRQYFNAIYFREPGGVLFEIATDPPGFAVDEPMETLGQALMLPAQYEERRAEIEAGLPEIRVPG